MENWIVSYRKEWLRPDVIAGLTTAAVVIPKAMAYATIAGLPVQVGLYTAFLPMVIYAVLGTSRALSVSTTTTLAILAAAELGEVAPNGDATSLLAAAATLTLLVGAMLVLASLSATGFRCQLYLRAGADWFQGRHWCGHRARPGPEDSWRAFCQRDVRPESACYCPRHSEHLPGNASRRSLHDPTAGSHGATLSQSTGSTTGRCSRHRRRLLPPLACPWSRIGRSHTAGSPFLHAPGLVPGGETLAGCVGHCPDELHRNHRGRPRLRAQR